MGSRTAPLPPQISVCPSPWGLTHPVPITVSLPDPVLPAAGSPQDAGSSGALPAPYRLRLSAAPSFAVLCVAHQAHMERRDYRKKNRNERRPWLLFSHLCPLAVAVPAAGAGLEGGRLLEGAAASPCAHRSLRDRRDWPDSSRWARDRATATSGGQERGHPAVSKEPWARCGGASPRGLRSESLAEHPPSPAGGL